MERTDALHLKEIANEFTVIETSGTPARDICVFGKF